jgi:transcriptional regulator with XRE-family HTH domain
MLKSRIKSNSGVDDRVNKNSELLDQLKVGFDYRTDKELAGFLGVSQKTVSSIRNGKQSLSPKQRIKIMDRLVAVKVRDLLIKISPESLGGELYRLSLRGAERLALSETGDGATAPDDNALIDLFRRYGQQGESFATDEDMAVYLGVSGSMISAVRHGETELGPLPRLRMLKAICPDADTEQIEQGIESSRYLLSLIMAHIKMKQSTENQDPKA